MEPIARVNDNLIVKLPTVSIGVPVQVLDT